MTASTDPMDEFAQIMAHFQQTEQARLSEAKTRLETQQATLNSIIKKAREEGDIDTETQAIQRLSAGVPRQPSPLRSHHR